MASCIPNVLPDVAPPQLVGVLPAGAVAAEIPWLRGPLRHDGGASRALLAASPRAAWHADGLAALCPDGPPVADPRAPRGREPPGLRLPGGRPGHDAGQVD